MTTKPAAHGVDLDGTLAHFDTWRGATHIGAPIPRMVARVRAWLEAGDVVYICTARMAGPSDAYPDCIPEVVRPAIEAWCLEHLGRVLPVTASKGHFSHLWDDSVHQVLRNRGETFKERVSERLRAVLAQHDEFLEFGCRCCGDNSARYWLKELLKEFEAL